MITSVEEENFDRVKEIEELMESVSSEGFSLKLIEIFENYDLENKYKVILKQRYVDIVDCNIVIASCYVRDIDKEEFFTTERVSFFDVDKVLKVQRHLEESAHQAHDYFKKHDEYKKLTIPELIKLIKPLIKKLFDPLEETKLREFEKNLDENDEKYKILDDVVNHICQRFTKGEFPHICKIIKEKENE